MCAPRIVRGTLWYFNWYSLSSAANTFPRSISLFEWFSPYFRGVCERLTLIYRFVYSLKPDRTRFAWDKWNYNIRLKTYARHVHNPLDLLFRVIDTAVFAPFVLHVVIISFRIRRTLFKTVTIKHYSNVITNAESRRSVTNATTFHYSNTRGA